MAERLPLTEVSGEEVLARVVYQIIRGDYDLFPELYDTPTLRLLELAADWHQSGFKIIADDMRLAAIWVANGGTVATWLRARIFAPVGRATILARPGRSRRR